jgi:hypothetical protein
MGPWAHVHIKEDKIWDNRHCGVASGEADEAWQGKAPSPLLTIDKVRYRTCHLTGTT